MQPFEDRQERIRKKEKSVGKHIVNVLLNKWKKGEKQKWNLGKEKNIRSPFTYS